MSHGKARRKASVDSANRTRYFTTSVKGAGIFLPSSKAYKRLSPTFSGSNPGTPTTPSLATFNLGGRGETKGAHTPPTPSLNSKFSQSVGPGRAGARSPDFKPKASRPSLPRPESPLRKAQNVISTPQSARPSLGGPKLSKSVIGGPRYAPSPTPGRFGATVAGSRSIAGDPGKRLPTTPKPGVKKSTHGRTESRSESRSEIRLGPEPMFDSESDNTPVQAAKTGYSTQPTQQISRPVSKQDDEVKHLRSELAQRDKQLEKQAADIEEMQNSVNELQTATPRLSSATTARSSRGSGVDDLDAPSLRALVREKNEKIKQLTDDFDSHRADFRETIDILEHTSDETNRLHEQKIEGLQAEVRDLHERIDRGEDMESVAQQLKQLEELVQELEEGLEDARRGEAEARGEVEFLRGEVERGKAELHREKQKAATALKNAGGQMDGGSSPGEAIREIKRRDDEIKGLKAIIHSLNQEEAPNTGSPKSSRRTSKRGSGHAQTNGHNNDAQLAEERQTREKLEREIKDLESLVDRKTYREEELEHEIERLRKTAAHTSSGGNSNGFSEHTTRPNSNQPLPNSSNHRPAPSRNSSIDWEERGIRDANAARANAGQGHQLESMPETSDSHSTTMTDGSNLWCDICDTGGHDVLTCTKMFGKPNTKRNGDYDETKPRLQQRDQEEDYTLTHGVGSNNNNALVDNHHLAPLSPPGTAAHAGSRSANVTPKAPQQQQTKMPNPMDSGNVAGKSSGVVDASRWCAICERDGHDATDCPFEGDY